LFLAERLDHLRYLLTGGLAFKGMDRGGLAQFTDDGV
jgi:hypothetical protein